MFRADAPITLRRLSRADFAMLSRWLSEPHVARWWNHETSQEAIERDFGPSVDGSDTAEIYIASTEGRDFGLVQRYTFEDNPGYIDELSPLVEVPGPALSIDYFVGEPDALRRGLGAAMIRTLVDATWRDYPAAPCIVVPVSAANAASSRVLERAGFHRMAEGPLTPDNPIDGTAHFVYRIDRPGTTQ